MIFAQNFQTADDEFALEHWFNLLSFFDASIEDDHFFFSFNGISMVIKCKSNDVPKLTNEYIFLDADLKHLLCNPLKERSIIVKIIRHEELILKDVPNSFTLLGMNFI